MISKEKISELCDFVFEDSPFKPNGWVENKITEWLEQNQPEPVVVGLSGGQVSELELLAHAHGILDAALGQVDAVAMKLFILSAQHKLDLLKEKLEIE